MDHCVQTPPPLPHPPVFPPSVICLCPFISRGLFLLICSRSLVVKKRPLQMLPLQRCVSRVMSKGNHEQESITEEIWGGGIWPRRADRSNVSVWGCVSGGGVVGLIVGVEGHTVICTLSAALRINPRDAFHPLSPFCTKSRWGFLTWNWIPAAGGRKPSQWCTWTPALPDRMTQCFHVLYCLSHRMRHPSCKCGWLTGKRSVLLLV